MGWRAVSGRESRRKDKRPRCLADGDKVIFESEEQARYALFEARMRKALYPNNYGNRREARYYPCTRNPMHFHLTSQDEPSRSR
jgi:hypothetical protein